jgi:AraC family transcriptional regulator, arabinose operon regulatory protein
MQGRLFLWSDGWLLLAGSINNRRHRHVAASLLFGLDQPLRVEAAGQMFAGRAVLVGPDVEQSLQSPGATLVVHLDPDNPLWLSLSAAGEDARLLPWGEPEARRLSALRDCDDAASARALLADMAGVAGLSLAPVRRPDPRALALASRLRKELPERLELALLAEQADVSAARLSRLFREAFAVTPKRFLLHLKMQRALHQWRPGMTATELAQVAGFYDQPHLIRTARDMFDALPSNFLGNPDFRLIRDQG